ncbi:MAG: hypothetical protein QOF21_3097 [Actinomycetota bacterium]|jgi:hypothetical protein
MGMAVSLLLIAAGAIMRYAVTVTAEGFNLHTIGMILMLVGVAGAVLSIAFWATWGGFGNVAGRGGAVVTSDRTVVREREVL